MASERQTDVREVGDVVRSVVFDVLRRRAAGESLPDEQVIASRPELADLLRAELEKLQQICAAGNNAGQPIRVDTSTADLRAVRTPGMFQIRCPHCREFFQASRDTPAPEIVCSVCGGHFSIADSGGDTRVAPALESLAHFDLVELLGVGGFGSVWKARDRKLDRTVAVKIPHRGTLNNEDLEKFLREARAAAQLQHPNIVRVYEVGRDGDSAYIVSDFVRGIALNDWLTGQQPTIRQATEICATIADALQHAHDRGVIHRDLKPANILIDGDGQPHLMDFGLARREVGEITVTLDGQVLGTPAYMSPEQARGEAHIADGRSDVYSVGVILFELLTRELPFRGNPRMLMHQVIHESPPSPRKFNANIAKDLETITLKCLEKDASQRYQSARQVAEELQRWIQGRPIEARPISHMAKTVRWIRKNPMPATVVALLLTLAVGAPIVAGRQAQLLADRNSALQAESKARNGAEQRRLEAEAAVRRETAARVKAEALTKLLMETLDGPAYSIPDKVWSLPIPFEHSRELIHENFANEPAIAAKLLYVLSRSMAVLRLRERALSTLHEAAELETAAHIDDGTYRRTCGLIATLYMENRDPRGLKWVQLAVRDLDKLLPEDDPARRNILDSAGTTYSTFGEFEKGLECYSECLRLRRMYDGPYHVDTLRMHENVCSTLTELRRYEDAIRLNNGALAGIRKEYGDDAKQVISPLGSLSYTLACAGRLDEALSMAQQRITLCRKHSMSPTASDSRAGGIWSLHAALLKADRNVQADSLLDEVIETEHEIEPNKPRREIIAESLSMRCKSGAAATQRAIRDSLQIPISIQASTDSLCLLGELRLLAGRPDEAVKFVKRAIADGGSEPFYYTSLGWALWAAGRRQQALEAFDKAIDDIPLERADLAQLAAAHFLSKLDVARFLELAKQRGKAEVPVAWFYIGQKHAWEGHRSEAKDAFETAVGEAEKAGASGVVVNFAAVCRDLSFLDNPL